MAKLRKSAAGLISRLCAVLLGLLGFACSPEDGPDGLDWEDGDELQLMYGTPYGVFEIKGEVKDNAGKPVEDANIIVTRTYLDSSLGGINGLTGTNGKFSIEKRIFPCDSMKVVCIPPGDKFEPDSTVVETKFVKDKNDTGWNSGRAKAKVNFKLKKKTGE